MTAQEVLDAIVAAVERCGCRLVKSHGHLGIVAARRLTPPGLQDLIEAHREALLAIVPDADGTETAAGPDCCVRVTRGRRTTHMDALRRLDSPELAAAVAAITEQEA